MFLRARLRMSCRLAEALVLGVALLWAIQVCWQVELHPVSGFRLGLGGGALKVCVDSNDGIMSLFPASEGVAGMEGWVSKRSGSWEWWFHSTMSQKWGMYLLSIPMWFVMLAAVGFAWHTRGREEEQREHDARCRRCNYNRRGLDINEPCPGCGARRGRFIV